MRWTILRTSAVKAGVSTLPFFHTREVVRRAFALVALIAASIGHAEAGLTISGTRVVLSADQREASLNMVNDGTHSRLVQAWVDTGDTNERPETTKAPFLVMPPLVRINPGNGIALRILMAAAPTVALDRETVFWLNVVEIPLLIKPSGETTNHLKFAVRTRLKLFYRPEGLPGTPGNAVNQVTWHPVSDGTAHSVECINDTPYNVSFTELAFKGTPSTKASITPGGMCPAKGRSTFPVAGSQGPEDKLVVGVINDFGGIDAHEVSLSR